MILINGIFQNLFQKKNNCYLNEVIKLFYNFKVLLMIDMKTENLEHRIILRSFQVNKHTIFSIREYFKSLSDANLKSNCKKNTFFSQVTY